MQKILIATIALFAAAPLARADIPHNPSANDYSSEQVNGDEAKEMYSSLKGSDIAGDSLRTESTSYRVQRNDEGTEQTICVVTTYHIIKQMPTYHCTIEKSKNGRPVPVFHPIRRMG